MGAIQNTLGIDNAEWNILLQYYFVSGIINKVTKETRRQLLENLQNPLWIKELKKRGITNLTIKKLENFAKKVNDNLYLIMPSEWIGRSIHHKRSLYYLIAYQNEISGIFLYSTIQVQVRKIKEYLTKEQWLEISTNILSEGDEILIGTLHIFIALGEGSPTMVTGKQESRELRSLISEIINTSEETYYYVDFHTHPLLNRKSPSLIGFTAEYSYDPAQDKFSPNDLASYTREQSIYPKLRAILLTPFNLLYWPQQNTRLIAIPYDKITELDPNFIKRRRDTIRKLQHLASKFSVTSILNSIHDP